MIGWLLGSSGRVASVEDGPARPSCANSGIGEADPFCNNTVVRVLEFGRESVTALALQECARTLTVQPDVVLIAGVVIAKKSERAVRTTMMTRLSDEVLAPRISKKPVRVRSYRAFCRGMRILRMMIRAEASSGMATRAPRIPASAPG